MVTLFESARVADPAAVEEIHRLVRGFSRRVCFGGGPPGAPALDWEDVAQEASQKFLTVGIRQYRGTGSEQGYLYGIVRATAIQMSRAARRSSHREQRWMSDGPVRTKDHTHRLDLRKILERLSAECSQIIERIHLLGDSHAELARELGLAESSVRARLSRCMRKARVIVTEETAS